MTVKVQTPEGNWLVWGTQPAAVSDAQVGDVVRFTATVERSPDKDGFGFFSKPSKAEVVSQPASLTLVESFYGSAVPEIPSFRRQRNRGISGTGSVVRPPAVE